MSMERFLYQELLTWKTQKTRLPLIIRGARQVGKSYLVKHFGLEQFSHLQVINFEKKPELGSCFTSLDPTDIITELELQTGKRVIEGESLLFLDEIQDCPQALKALRYFAEEMPDLHVIAAGSLLEFLLEEASFSFPVGRVQVMNLGPLTFYEYLLARGQKGLVDHLRNSGKISEGVHKRLLEFVREFMCVGGMPGVVETFLATDSYLEVKRRQRAILDMYALDFGKYETKKSDYKHLKTLFERAPNIAGKHFKFSKIDPHAANPARDYREALHRLTQARLITQVYSANGNGLPLRAGKNEKKFKLFMLDVGLLLNRLGWESFKIAKNDTASLFLGVIAEQFVAQELIALQDPFIERGLYYWENPATGSEAEIDFLVNIENKMVPIEVKSGSSKKLKSLRQFMNLRRIAPGVRISELPKDDQGDILTVPFYMIAELPKLLVEND